MTQAAGDLSLLEAAIAREWLMIECGVGTLAPCRPRQVEEGVT
jgi:hypothetical protein